MDDLEFQPLTPERFGDLEALFGKSGAWGGCWCMWWKWSAKEFEANKGEPNRLALQAACTTRPPGLIAYSGGQPVGWVAIEPMEAYPRLLASRTLKPVDDQPAWAVTCFFVSRKARRNGVSVALLEAAVGWAASHGAQVVEGYPSLKSGTDWMGTPATYERCGFERVSEPKGSRVLMRRRARGGS